MRNHEENTALTSGEIGSLWQTYQYESLAICGMKFFLKHVDDKEMEKLMKKVLAISMKRLEQAKKFLTVENYPIPEGFSDADVNLEAPRLFSDELYLEYLLHTLQIEFLNYSMAMIHAAKLPIQQFYAEVMQDTMKMEMETKELVKKKGLLLRAPSIPPVSHTSYIQQKETFLAGWFGNRRPLIAAEISQLVFNAKRNALGQAVIAAFSQVTESEELRKYFLKGHDLSKKQLQVFAKKLDEENLSSAALNKTDQVTTSTEAPFSDKLMLTFITSLIASGIAEYGISMSMSPRHDLGAMYTRLTADIAVYSNEGAKILIDNAWMETPPIAADRKKIAKKNKR